MPAAKGSARTPLGPIMIPYLKNQENYGRLTFSTKLEGDIFWIKIIEVTNLLPRSGGTLPNPYLKVLTLSDMGGGALCARTNLKYYLWLIQCLKVWNFFMTFPNYVCTSFWSKNQNIFWGGCPLLAPSKKCRKKSKEYFCTWPPIFIL